MLERFSDWSLRKRLLSIATTTLLASACIGGVAMYWAETLEEDRMLDARLEHLGAIVLSLADGELRQREEPGATSSGQLSAQPDTPLLYCYQIWTREGVLLRSHEAPVDQPLAMLSRLGHQTVNLRGEEYRVLSLQSSDQRLVVQVAATVEERRGEGGLVARYFAAFLVVPFGLVLFASWLLLRRSLHSIDALATRLRDRNPLDVTPVRVDDPPEEMLPILCSFDKLLARTGHALSVERRFTSVAAHEMRTPLAGLRAQAEVAVLADSDSELREGLRAVIVGADRASHLLDQLLALARVESMPQEIRQHVEGVDVSDVYQSVMDQLGPRHSDRHVIMSARFNAPTIQCHRFALSLLIRNLLANAILYTPAGGRAQVFTEQLVGGVRLVVDDSGPGIAQEDRERAFERFSRLDQASVEGVGLGLSIALSVVELHSGKILLLDSPLGGLRVHVQFPQA